MGKQLPTSTGDRRISEPSTMSVPTHGFLVRIFLVEVWGSQTKIIQQNSAWEGGRLSGGWGSLVVIWGFQLKKAKGLASKKKHPKMRSESSWEDFSIPPAKLLRWSWCSDIWVKLRDEVWRTFFWVGILSSKGRCYDLVYIKNHKSYIKYHISNIIYHI